MTHFAYLEEGMRTLSTIEAGERLGVHDLTIRRWIEEGRFPNAFRKNPFNDKSPYRIPETDIKAFEAERQKAPSEQ